MESSIVVRLDERLREAGDVLGVSGVLSFEAFVMGDRVFEVPDGIGYDLLLTHSGEAILATGTTTARLVGECDRCLDKAELSLEGEVAVLYGFPGRDFDPEQQEDMEIFPLREDEIDLTAPVVASIAVEIPFKVLCSPQCKGLCPVCGQNLNHGSCNCDSERATSPDPFNPFSVLKSLTEEESNTE